MAKRVHSRNRTSERRPTFEVARDFGLTTLGFIARVNELPLGWRISTHMDLLSPQQIEDIRAALENPGAQDTQPIPNTAPPSTDRVLQRTAPQRAPDAGVPFFAVAASLGLTDIELAERIKDAGLNIETSNHMAPMSAQQIKTIRNALGAPSATSTRDSSTTASKAKDSPMSNSFTGPVRVHQIAKSLGLSFAELKEKASAAGLSNDLSSHLRQVNADEANAIVSSLAAPAAPRRRGRPAAAAPAASKSRRPGRAPRQPVVEQPTASSAENKLRAYEAAKNLGMSYKELRAALQGASLSFEISSHLTHLSDEQVAELSTALASSTKAAPGNNSEPPKAKAKAKAKPAKAKAKAADSAVSFPDPETDDSERQFKRTWEVAKDLGYDSPSLRLKFEEWGIPVDVSTHMKWISYNQCLAINEQLATLNVKQRIPMAPSKRDIRLYELAREMNLEVPDLRDKIDALALGFDVSTHMKRLSAPQVAIIRERVEPGDPSAMATDEPRMRMHQVARKAGLDFKEFKTAVNQSKARIKVTTHLQFVTEDEATGILKAIAGYKPAPTVEAPPRKRGRPRKNPVTTMQTEQKVRLHVVASDLGLTPKELIKASASFGLAYKLSSHLQNLTSSQVEEIKSAFKAAPPATETTTAASNEKRRPGRPRKQNADAPAAAPAPKNAAPTETPPAEKPAPRADHKVDDAPKADNGPATSFATEYLKQILPAMGVARPRISVTENGDFLEFEISGFESDRLLGSANAAARTDLVESLEQLTTKAVQNHSGSSLQIRIDVGGFRKGRRADVAEAASRLARFVVESNLAVSFAVMSAFDRFAFHSELKAAPDVRSESEGQGAQRRLGVRASRRPQS